MFHSLTPDLGDNEEVFYKKVNRILDAGFYIGLNGIITFKNAKLLRNVFLKVIRERLEKGRVISRSNPKDLSRDKRDFRLKDLYDTGFVLETDGPFLAPEGKRGERNEPGNVKDVWEFIKISTK